MSTVLDIPVQPISTNQKSRVGQPTLKPTNQSQSLAKVTPHTNQSRPSVSVIVPAHNCAEFLTACLQSILSQSWQNLQVIVVDDGSKDATASILQTFQQQSSRLEVYRQPSALGASCARNIGLDKATGEYVLFVDADDWLSPFAVEKMIDAIQKNPASFVIGGHVQKKQNQEFEHFDFSSLTLLNREKLYGYVEQYLAQPYKKVMLVHCWGRLYQRALIEKYQIRFSEGLSQFEDVHFNFQYLDKVQSVTYLPEGLYHHRIHQQQSLSQQMGMENGFLEKTRTAFSQVSVFLQRQYGIQRAVADKMVDATVVNMWLVSILRLCRRFKKAPSKDVYQQISQIVTSSAFKKYIRLIRPQKGESHLLYWASRTGIVPMVLIAGLLRVTFLQLNYFWRAE